MDTFSITVTEPFKPHGGTVLSLTLTQPYTKPNAVITIRFDYDTTIRSDYDVSRAPASSSTQAKNEHVDLTS